MKNPLPAQNMVMLVIRSDTNIPGQLIRFIISGLANTAVDFAVFNTLILLLGINQGWPLLCINLAAVMAAAANSYLLNRYWTFSSPDYHRGEIIRFIITTAAGFAINSLLVITASLMASRFPWPTLLVLNGGKLLAALVSATWNFILYRNWVFVGNQPLQKEAPPFQPGLVSIIIPAYNEEHRLPARLTRLATSLPCCFPVEIIVVDDGSTDNTLILAKELASRHPVIRCLHYDRNQGKGYAVKTGMLHAQGEFRLYTDADETFTSDHICEVVNRLQQGAGIVIGCRPTRSAQRINGESSLRRLMGKVFNLIVQKTLLPGIDDSQCGIKGFHYQVATRLFPLQTLKGFAFDVELLVLARSLGYQAEKVLVKAIECPGSRVNRLLSPLQMSGELIKIKINLFTNQYGLPGGNQPLVNFLTVLTLFTAALAVRIPWLWEVPRFIDELKEVGLGYLIYTGAALPLHNAAHDIGALHNYILALVFKILGPGIYWPRLYVATTAAITVVLVFYLARHIYGVGTAWLAAGLLLTNGMHILVTHMAWSNSTTPFFFTLAMLATLLTEKKKSGGWLIISAFLWALTLQTHSSVIIFIPVVLIYVLRPSFRSSSRISPHSYLLAALAFVTGYANMIYFNILTRGGSLHWLKYKTYALETNLTPFSYLANLGNLLVDLFRTLSSAYTRYPDVSNYFLNPIFTATLILLVIGIIYNWKKPYNLPVWLLLAGTLAIPMFNQRYAFFISTRYIMPLVLCSILSIASAIVLIYHRISRSTWTDRFYPALRVAAPTIAILLILAQLFPFYNYCRNVANTNASNRMALDIISLIETVPEKDHTTIVLDNQLPLENSPLPGLLTLQGQSFLMLSADSPEPVKDQWLEYIKDQPNQRILAVLDTVTFNYLYDFINPQQVNCLSCQVVIPSPKPEPRKIYIIETSPSDRTP
ncbi:glycosyltransferase [Syntrophomonas erecta subsp. sporosyntropha]